MKVDPQLRQPSEEELHYLGDHPCNRLSELQIDEFPSFGERLVGSLEHADNLHPSVSVVERSLAVLDALDEITQL